MTILDDGLTKEWHGRIWLNPPYGQETRKWLAKLVDHGNGIALVFARTETQMFHQYVWKQADAVYFFEGRLHFCDINGVQARGNAGGPSVLVAYGENNVECLQRFNRGVLLRIKNILTGSTEE